MKLNELIIEEMADKIMDLAATFGAQWRPIAHRDCAELEEPRERIVRWLRSSIPKAVMR